MNRYNFGNQITNGTQILSVAGRTAAGDIYQSRQRKINDLSSGLNNLSEDELRQYGRYRADQMRQQMKDFYGNEDIDYQSVRGPTSSTFGSGTGTDKGFNPKSERPVSGGIETNKVKDIDLSNAEPEFAPKKLGSPQEPIEVTDYEIYDLNSLGYQDNSEQFKELNMKTSRDIGWLERRKQISSNKGVVPYANV